MNLEAAQKIIDITRKHSPGSFISTNFELIVDPRNNVYFRLEDVETERDVKRKVIKWLSRPSYKGVSNNCRIRVRKIFNEYLGKDFDTEDIELIYALLGNGCNSELCEKFIDSRFDLTVLKDGEDNQ